MNRSADLGPGTFRPTNCRVGDRRSGRIRSSSFVRVQFHQHSPCEVGHFAREQHIAGLGMNPAGVENEIEALAFADSAGDDVVVFVDYSDRKSVV